MLIILVTSRNRDVSNFRELVLKASKNIFFLQDLKSIMKMMTKTGRNLEQLQREG